MFKETQLLLRVFEKDKVAKPTLLDVGAHIGKFSLPFAKRGWFIIAVEPEAENYRKLCANLKDIPDATLIKKAVSNVTEKNIPFYVSAEHWGIHSLRPFHYSHKKEILIEVVRLDELLRELGVNNISLLKIDIEGADFMALQGFDFENMHPEIVMCEFMDYRSLEHFNYDHHEIVKFMQNFNYIAYVSEWAPFSSYGKEDKSAPKHQWLNCEKYPLDHDPEWGNLIFIKPDKNVLFAEVLGQYVQSINHPSSRSASLRKFKKLCYKNSLLRNVCRTLVYFKRRQLISSFFSLSIRSFRNIRSIVSLARLANPILIFRLLIRLRRIEKNIIGRYPGSVIDKLAHSVPVYVASSTNENKRFFAHVEIGTLFGGSVLAKLESLDLANKKHTVIAIDPLDSFYGQDVDPSSGYPISEEIVWKNINNLGKNDSQIQLVKAYSNSLTAYDLLSDFGVLTVFIDGDHSYQGVKSDWEIYSKFVEPGGFVIFDDYGEASWPDVTRFLDDLSRNLANDWEYLCKADTTIIFQRTLINKY